LKGGSLDWFTVRHWVRVSGSGFSVGLVPVDAPLVCLGDINRGTWPKKFRSKDATVYSYAMNNYWHTNYFREQSGHYTFRYVLTSGQSLSPASLSRLGLDAMTPLEHQQVISNDKDGNPARALSPAPQSFLTVSSPDVEVEDWKSAMDGHGTIVRLVEVGGESTTVKLTFPMFHLQQAWITNAVEKDQSPLRVEGNSLEVPVKPHQIVTLRIVAAQ
ncbi:MAG: glycosyl hydrolase-related protein, partial [Acidobacteriota bacterium]